MLFLKSFFLAILALAGLVASQVTISTDGHSPVSGNVSTNRFSNTNFLELSITIVDLVEFDFRKRQFIFVETIIIRAIASTGIYSWTPSKKFPAGKNYFILMTDSQGNARMTPVFTLT